MSGGVDTPPALDLEQRRALERRLLERRRGQAIARLEPVSRDGELPLSFAQRRMWFLFRLDPQDCQHNLSRVLRVRGPLDLARLRRALEIVQTRHEVLRTSFPSTDGRPRQEIAPPGPFALAERVLEIADPAARETGLRALLEEAVRVPFDLAQGPVFRALVVRLAPDEHVLALMIHHIAGDEWSLRILNQEIAAAYAGDAASLPTLPIQYADFAVWQRQWMDGGNGATQLEYWRRRLAGVPALLELNPGRARPPVQALRGARHVWHVAPAVVARLDALATSVGATPFMLSLAALAILLQRYSLRDDIVVGTPISGRQRPETQLLVGFFANTLALRIDADGNPSFRDFLQRVRGRVLEGFDNQDLPFEKVVDVVGHARARSHTPVFQVLFTHRHEIGHALDGSGLEVTPILVDDGTAKTDLWLAIEDGAQGRRAMIEIDAELFDTGAAVRMAGQLDQLFASIAADPDAPIRTLEMSPPAERAARAVWGGAPLRPVTGSIAAAFAAQVAARPDAIALLSDERRVSYAALDRWSTRLAHRLRAAGIGPEQVVAITAERTPALIAGLLAIAKSGAAYLPIDPVLPSARIAFMLADADARLVLVQDARAPADAFGTVPTLRLEPEDAAPADAGDAAPLDAAPLDAAPLDAGGPQRLAYVMYTSGSTGTPKGVAIEQAGVLRLVRDADYARFGPEERVLQLAPVAFDASTFEIWGALLNGGCLVQLREPTPGLGDIARAIAAHEITTLWLTAGLFHRMVDHELGSFARLRQVLAGGDVLSLAHVRRFRAAHPHVALINGYGPTETTTFACTFAITDDAALTHAVPIGRPIANTRIEVLDDRLQPVPVGVTGELVIAGPGVARGYLNAPELTAARFLTDPAVPGGRRYRTGDLVRFRDDGTLDFIGRKDRQLKLRGFRIEPAEIEAALLRHPALRAAAVIARPDGRGEPQLVAYCVGREGAAAPEPASLVAHLRGLLPAYMVPVDFVALSELPLTPQGKVDGAALLALHRPSEAGGRRARGPRDGLETGLVELWQRVLGVEEVGIDDDFFALGGHSLLASEMFAHLDRMLAHPLPLATIFDAPTIAQLAERVRHADDRAWPAAVPMRAGSTGTTPLFAIPGIGGNVVCFAGLAQELSGAAAVIGLPARGLDGREAPLATIEEIAADHVARMRAIQPEGPYDLLGTCIGGIVAFEIAQQLRAAGERVGLLALLDPAFRGVPTSRVETERAPRAVRSGLGRFVGGRARAYASEIAQLQIKEWGPYAMRKLSALARSTTRGGLPADLKREIAQNRVVAVHREALRRYVPRPYDGDAVLLRSADRRLKAHAPARDPAAWFHGRLETTLVPGEDSGAALRAPNLVATAQVLRARLLARDVDGA